MYVSLIAKVLLRMDKLSEFARALSGRDAVVLEVVDGLGVARSTRSRWARGKLLPSVERAKELRALLAEKGREVPLDWFFPPG